MLHFCISYAWILQFLSLTSAYHMLDFCKPYAWLLPRKLCPYYFNSTNKQTIEQGARFYHLKYFQIKYFQIFCHRARHKAIAPVLWLNYNLRCTFLHFTSLCGHIARNSTTDLNHRAHKQSPGHTTATNQPDCSFSRAPSLIHCVFFSQSFASSKWFWSQ